MPKNIFTSEEFMKFLDALYKKACDGISVIGDKFQIPSVEQQAADYLVKYSDTQKAAKAMMRNQIAKCTTSGFITGLGGVIVLPVAIPANVGSVLYVQMQMIACAAYMGGYDIESDQVRTVAYACLAGVSFTELMKKFGIDFGKKIAIEAIKKIPIETLRAINKKLGFLFITKFGKTGFINLGKMVPVVGAVVNGGFDLFETRAISKAAYKIFIENDFSVGEKYEDIIDVDYVEVEADTNVKTEQSMIDDEKERALDQDSPSDND